MNRQPVIDALCAKIAKSQVVTLPDGSVRLADPPDLDKMALFYAKSMDWPNGEERCRGLVKDGGAAALLMELDEIVIWK